MTPSEDARRSAPGKRSRSIRKARRSQAKDFDDLYQRPRGWDRRNLAVLMFILVFVITLVADGVYAFSNVKAGLEDVAEEFDAARKAVENGNLDEAERRFDAADEAARRAASAAAHPSVSLASILPFIDRDVAVIRSLTEAAVLVGDAGATTVDAGRRLGGTTSKELATAFYRDGEVQLETIRAGAPFVARTVTLLSDAQEVLDAAPEPTVDALGEALDRSVDQVARAGDAAHSASTLVHTLPPLFGGDGPRRYLLVFQSPSEARATGGSIGLYGILEAVDGRIALTRIGPFPELFTGPDPSAAAENINYSPDFAVVAESLLKLYERSTGSRLDGVVASDPETLGELTRGTGPVRGAGLATPIGPDNAVDLLLRDAYLTFEGDPAAQLRFLSTLIRNVYGALGRDDIDAPALISGLGNATRSQHLKIYSTYPQENVGLEDLGASGSLETAPGDLQFIFHNNLARNKVDYFLGRSIDTRVRMTLDGYALVTTTVSLRNNARPEPDALTSSFDGSAPPGVNRMSLAALVPTEAVARPWSIGGRSVRPTEERRDGFLRLFADLRIPPGDFERVRISYEIPRATDILRGGAFSMTLWPQATVRPDRYSLTFVPPPGFEIVAQDGRAEGSSSRFSGILDRPLTFGIEVRPVET